MHSVCFNSTTQFLYANLSKCRTFGIKANSLRKSFCFTKKDINKQLYKSRKMTHSSLVLFMVRMTRDLRLHSSKFDNITKTDINRNYSPNTIDWTLTVRRTK